jgi:hypothetical protein
MSKAGQNMALITKQRRYKGRLQVKNNFLNIEMNSPMNNKQGKYPQKNLLKQ